MAAWRKHEGDCRRRKRFVLTLVIVLPKCGARFIASKLAAPEDYWSLSFAFSRTSASSSLANHFRMAAGVAEFSATANQLCVLSSALGNRPRMADGVFGLLATL